MMKQMESGSLINKSHELTRGSRLARNTLLNLMGYFAPLVVAIFTIPAIVNGLGTERFGILTLAWVFIGYLSLLDLGLSRALTKLVAENIGKGNEKDIPSLIWTALFVMFILGVAVMLCVIPSIPWLVRDILNISKAFEEESLKAFYVLAASIPVVITSVGFRGVLDAYQRFDLTNAVRIPLGIFSFSAPLLVLPFSEPLFLVVILLVAGRLLACLAQIFFCFHVVPSLGEGIVFRRTMVGPLVRFGGWTTVTNVVNPLLVYLDRFIIGSLISVAAVTYYATPSEVVTKLFLISGSMMGVLFPAFSISYGQDSDRTLLLFDRGIKYVFLALFPIILVFVTFAGEGLDFWLGYEFALKSTRVLQWLSVGVLIYSLGQVPLAFLHGAGRPDLTAKLHLLELPVYLLGLWFLIGALGILGAAIAWVVRIALDSVMLFVMAQRLLKTGMAMTMLRLLLLGMAMVVLVSGTLLAGPFIKGAFLFVMFLIYVLVTWFMVLGNDEKGLILDRLKTIQLPG